jgi:hypothetical protein
MEEEERLPENTEKAIAWLNMRDLADRDLRDTQSEPTELIGEFTKEDEFENLIRASNNENAGNAKQRGRTSIKETYYWPIIKQRANTMGRFRNHQAGKLGLLRRRSMRPKDWSWR